GPAHARTGAEAVGIAPLIAGEAKPVVLRRKPAAREAWIEALLATLRRAQPRLRKRRKRCEKNAGKGDAAKAGHAIESTQRALGCPPRISSASASRTSGSVRPRWRISE